MALTIGKVACIWVFNVYVKRPFIFVPISMICRSYASPMAFNFNQRVVLLGLTSITNM